MNGIKRALNERNIKRCEKAFRKGNMIAKKYA
jgi:hypothetical protein